LPSGEKYSTIHFEEMLAFFLDEERHMYKWVIAFDENVMLLSRGKLWRVNPRSVRGMKQGPEAF
jgi:hypothetical protein